MDPKWVHRSNSDFEFRPFDSQFSNDYLSSSSKDRDTGVSHNPSSDIVLRIVPSITTSASPMSSGYLGGVRHLRVDDVPYAIDLIPQSMTQEILDEYQDAFVIPRSSRMRPITFMESLSSSSLGLTAFNLTS